MAKSFSEEKKQLWKEKILKQRESGLSVAVWCRQNNFNAHTFGYWQGKLFPKKLDSSSLTEIKDRANTNERTGIALEYQGISIYLDKEFDSLALTQCLKAMKGMVC